MAKLQFFSAKIKVMYEINRIKLRLMCLYAVRDHEAAIPFPHIWSDPWNKWFKEAFQANWNS